LDNKELFEVKNKKCPKCKAKKVFRDTEVTFCGDCGKVINHNSIVDVIIDENLKLEVGKIYSAKKIEEKIKNNFADNYFFMNALLSSNRLQPYFKVLSKKNSAKKSK
jgi:hypothetical protein